MLKNEKVRVIEGVEADEFCLNLGKSELWFIETSKNCESESIFSLDEWLFWGKRKSYFAEKNKIGKNESFVLQRFFEEIGKKEVLP